MKADFLPSYDLLELLTNKFKIIISANSDFISSSLYLFTKEQNKKIVTLNFIVVISKNVNIYAIWRVHDSFAAAGVCINIETFQAFNETTTVVSTILEKVIFIASFIILMFCKLHRHKHRAHSNQAENATNYSIIRQFFLQFYNF